MKKLVLTVAVLSMTSALFAQQVPAKAWNSEKKEALMDTALKKTLEEAAKTSQEGIAFEAAYQQYVNLLSSEGATAEQKQESFVKMADAYMQIQDNQRVVKYVPYFFKIFNVKGENVFFVTLLKEQVAALPEKADQEKYGLFVKLAEVDTVVNDFLRQQVGKKLLLKQGEEASEKEQVMMQQAAKVLENAMMKQIFLRAKFLSLNNVEKKQ